MSWKHTCRCFQVLVWFAFWKIPAFKCKIPHKITMLSPSASCSPHILIIPFVVFSLHVHCSFTFPLLTYVTSYKYERILHSHACLCGPPEAIRASTFYHAAVWLCLARGTSLEPDVSPSASGAGTWLYGHTHKRGRSTCPHRKKQGQPHPASARKAESPLASERGKQPLSSSFKGLNTRNTSWPGAHHVCTRFQANIYFPPLPL